MIRSLLDDNTKILVQGITGKAASYHTKLMIDYGTRIVAGVSPNTKIKDVHGVPVYGSVKNAVKEHNVDASIIFVPAYAAVDAIVEAADSLVPMIVCITEHVPIHDMIKVKAYIESKGVQLIGPNCPGLIVPGKAKLGIMPGHIHVPGSVGIVSRSGTLTYEAVNELSNAGVGQTLAIGIGGDPIIGTSFIEVLKYFNDDSSTKLVVMIGEIGGNSEEKAAVWISENMNKPVIGFISGKAAPHGKRMGHAGAIISSGQGTAIDKAKALKAAGVVIADTPKQIVNIAKEMLSID